MRGTTWTGTIAEDKAFEPGAGFSDHRSHDMRTTWTGTVTTWTGTVAGETDFTLCAGMSVV